MATVGIELLTNIVMLQSEFKLSATQSTVRSSWSQRKKRGKACSQVRCKSVEENKSMILWADTICSQAVKFPKALGLFSGKLGNSCYPFSHTLQQINKFELHICFTCDGKPDALTDIKVFPFVWCSLGKQMVGSYQVSVVKSISWRNHSLVTKTQFLEKEKLPGLNIFLVWYLRMK